MNCKGWRRAPCGGNLAGIRSESQAFESPPTATMRSDQTLHKPKPSRVSEQVDYRFSSSLVGTSVQLGTSVREGDFDGDFGGDFDFDFDGDGDFGGDFGGDGEEPR